jgi:hypothetical protein
VQTHARTRVHLHTYGQAPNAPQQSQQYPPSDMHYLANEVQGMYYAMNAQASQSLPSLVSFLDTSFFVLGDPFFETGLGGDIVH